MVGNYFAIARRTGIKNRQIEAEDTVQICGYVVIWVTVLRYFFNDINSIRPSLQNSIFGRKEG